MAKHLLPIGTTIGIYPTENSDDFEMAKVTRRDGDRIFIAYTETDTPGFWTDEAEFFATLTPSCVRDLIGPRA